jgi:iron complex transport system ATP-binding protein
MDETATAHLAAKYLDQLSSGEKQRVVIARALAQQPQLLLLDEPTAHLDLSHQVEILGLLKRLKSERGLTVILVSHDLNAAAASADRLLLLKGGAVLTAGRPEEVMRPEILEKAYGCHIWSGTDPETGAIHILPRL